MTRVEEDREAQRVAEQRRIEDLNRAKLQEASDRFQKVVAQKQQGTRETAAKQTDAKGKAQTQRQAAARGSASAALLARRGIQSHNLTAQCQRHGDTAGTKAAVETTSRRAEISEDANQATERHERINREESRASHDPLAAIAGDERRESGAGGGAEGEGAMDRRGQRQPEIIAQPAATAQSEAPASARATRLSVELIEQLVNRVFAGVTPEGLSQFTIELNSDVLSGARLDVTGKDGKIACTFHTDDKNVGRLVKASEGALARAFAQKGLSLERLEVVER
jgi:hypothetical protein